MKIKRFDVVKIINKGDIYFNRNGVIIIILKSSNYPYRVCFGVDRWDNGIIGIYYLQDLLKASQKPTIERFK